MITKKEFKSHISGILSGHLKCLGFEGKGFNYRMDSEHFVFVIGIYRMPHEAQCGIVLGVQPKCMDFNEIGKVDFNKLTQSDCVFRTFVSSEGAKDHIHNMWWYTPKENHNHEIAMEMIDVVKEHALPVIERFKADKDILLKIEISDLKTMRTFVLEKFADLKRFGGADVRMAWVLAKAHEKEHLAKAKEFAWYGLSNVRCDKFRGYKDFNAIIDKNDGIDILAELNLV